jgi:GntR family transcriptional regulator
MERKLMVDPSSSSAFVPSADEVSARLHIPIYVQIRDALAERIRSGELPPGTQIPSERTLAQQYGVSRMTVRQAIADLVNAGLAKRLQGNGTYVAEPKVEQVLNPLLSFTEQMRRRGIAPGARLIDVSVIEAHRKLGEALALSVGERVYRIIRLRTGNNQPMVLETSYFPCRDCPGIDRFDLERRSIYRILEEEYGIRLVRAVQSLEPTIANEVESRLLGVEQGAPLLLIERTAYSELDKPVEYAKDLYRGDRSRFVMSMSLDLK